MNLSVECSISRCKGKKKSLFGEGRGGDKANRGLTKERLRKIGGKGIKK